MVLMIQASESVVDELCATVSYGNGDEGYSGGKR